MLVSPNSSIWRPGRGVLFVGAQPAAVGRAAGVVSALALSHGIEAQNQVAEARQPLAAALVVPGLAVGGVPHLEQHAREGRLARGGDVEVRGDVEVGLAFVDHLFEAVARALERSQRCARSAACAPACRPISFQKVSRTQRWRSRIASGVVSLAISRVAPGVGARGQVAQGSPAGSASSRGNRRRAAEKRKKSQPTTVVFGS